MQNMIVIPSKSRYELMLERLGSEDASRRYFGQTEVWEYILSSYHAQRESLEHIKHACERYSIPFIDRSCLTPDVIGAHDTFVFAGGDNHFTYCAQEVLQYQCAGRSNATTLDGGRKKVLGVVLDSTKSLGALLQATPDAFIDALPRLLRGDYAVQSWTSLEARVRSDRNVAVPHPAVGEYFIGEEMRADMSRNRAYIDGTRVLLEKGSGILAVTGAGAGDGSWYDTNHVLMYGEPDVLGREERMVHAIVTENKRASNRPVVSSGTGSEDAKGLRGKITLHPGQTLTIYSYNDHRGVILPDSHPEHSVPFMIGAVAEVSIARLPLHVITP